MKNTLITGFALAVLLCSCTMADDAGISQEDVALAKHLALMEELEREAEKEDEQAGRKKRVQPPTPKQLTQTQEERFVAIAHKWVYRLWATNGVYGGNITIKNLKNPTWAYYGSVWTNEFNKHVVSGWQEPVTDSMPWERIKIEFHMFVGNQRQKDWIWFNFLGDGSVYSVLNSCFKYPNVPYTHGDWKPIHTNEQMARQKAAEYAAMFGVSNLWDKTKFESRSFGFFDGVWEFSLTPFVNGYPTLYAISVHVADLPGCPLGNFFSGLYQIPTNLPTKVVLTSEEGRKKGFEYLKKYFPLKELTPKLTFHSNRLEYISPNYNYIRPADDSGFSDYEPKWNEVALVWNNAFKKPEGTGFPWVHIYVDAATGKMLGGSD